MASGSRVVLDANILIRAVLGARVKKIITDHAEHAEFFAPEVAYGDAERYLPDILAKHDRAVEIDDALAFLEQLRAVVVSVPEELYEHRKADALSRIESRDPDDWPVLASALVIECPVWDRGSRLLRHRSADVDDGPDRALLRAGATGKQGLMQHGRRSARKSAPRGVAREEAAMIQIDIDADLNMEDDHERNFARLPASNPRIKVGAVTSRAALASGRGSRSTRSTTRSCSSTR